MEGDLIAEAVHADGGVVADVELADLEETAAVAETAHRRLKNTNNNKKCFCATMC